MPNNVNFYILHITFHMSLKLKQVENAFFSILKAKKFTKPKKTAFLCYLTVTDVTETCR